MRFRRLEQPMDAPLPEPQVLGVDIDPESAALYDQFATGRSLNDIYDVWKDEQVTNPTIRQRAVAALTVPKADWLPFPHGDQAFGCFMHMQEDIGGEYSSSLRKRLDGRPELAAEAAQGILYWMDNNAGRIQREMRLRWMEYQDAIPTFLPMVDEPLADRLFGHFAINDLDEYEGMDLTSGYQPLMGLLYDNAVPQKYKTDAVNKWQEIARLEEQGVRQPRVEHERARVKMTEFVQTWAYGEHVDDAIMTTLVRFLEAQKVAAFDTSTYVTGFAASKVAKHITDMDLLFSFAWRHIALPEDSKAGGQFAITDRFDLSLVTWLQEEAQRREAPGFDAKADALIQTYEAVCRQKIAQQAAETALRAQLRA